MNGYGFEVRPVPGGYKPCIKVCRESEAQPIKGKGGKDKVFPRRDEAMAEILLHTYAFMNGHEIRGERFDGTSSYREDMDRRFFKQPGEGERKAVGA